MNNREIEAKFLEVNKAQIIQKLQDLGAEDHGEKLLKELIFYDQKGEWRRSGKKFVRIRQDFDGIKLTYKSVTDARTPVAEEIEFGIENIAIAVAFLERLGLETARRQEKRRHKFKLGRVIFDIDTWPGVPAYLEIEGPSEEEIKRAAEKLGFDWKRAVFGTSTMILEKHYRIPIRTLSTFMFDQVA